MENPDRFNSIDFTLTGPRWSRDEQLPPGQVRFTAITDGRMIGCQRLLLTDDLSRIESLYVQPSIGPRGGTGGEFIGQWLVGDGCYMGSAGARNTVLFCVEGGLIVGIYDGSSEGWDRTYSHMRRRFDEGDRSVVPGDDERAQMEIERERAKHLPRLRIPGDPPRS